MSETIRLDQFLKYHKGIDSREKSSDLILAGVVFVNGVVITKPAKIISMKDVVEVKKEKYSYVSRGGVKLAKAIDRFNIDVKNKIAIDVGASTGGFTDCLLQKGCKKIYAIDVGKEQLHDSLRDDKRVISMENINFRYVKKESFIEPIDIMTVDVSFISLAKILEKLSELSHTNTDIIMLFKPQFEVGRLYVNNGVVKDKAIYKQALLSLVEQAKKFQINYLDSFMSPITGKKKNNQEYLSLWKKV